MDSHSLELPAMRINQTESRKVFVFALDAEALSVVSGVRRVSRSASSELDGYQRVEQSRHVLGIRRYIDSPDPLIPNGIVVALSSFVSFAEMSRLDDQTSIGQLTFDLKRTTDEPLAWIVDGQQRVAAMRGAIRRNFRIVATGFFPTDYEDERRQFILVNSAKPLPSSLILELIPHTTGPLPEKLARRKTAAAVTMALNIADTSSFYKQIKTLTNPGGSVRDNSVIRLAENSLSNGVLYNFRDQKTGGGDVAAMVRLISDWFWAVRDVFTIDWDRDIRHCRLKHGAGIVALGAALDEYCARTEQSRWTRSSFTDVLRVIAPSCAWSSGEWLLDGERPRAWSQIQNTAQDVRFLCRSLNSLIAKAMSESS